MLSVLNFRIPQGVEQTGEGIAEAVVFLAVSAHVTGQSIVVDGGARGMGSILDDGQVVSPSDLYNLVHSARVAAIVHDDDGSCALVDMLLNAVR